MVNMLLRDQDKEFEAQLAKKSSHLLSERSASVTAVPSSAVQASSVDTMSSIGTFSIADFIVTTQV